MGRASRRKQQRRSGIVDAGAVKGPSTVAKIPAICWGNDGPLTPARDLDALAAPLENCAGEMIPMWAAISVLSRVGMGKPSRSCVPASYQLAGALRHLGYEADPVAASVNVLGPSGRSTDIGVWKHPPRIQHPGTTDGHLVVWTPSFRRLIDLTVCQDPQLHSAAQENPNLAAPVVGVLPQFAVFGEGPPPMIPRPPFVLTYMLLPQYTPFIAPLWEDSDLTDQLKIGALAVAYDALEIVRAVEGDDSGARRATGHGMRALLDGEAQLPPMPTPA